jgi:hypothetical protein
MKVDKIWKLTKVVRVRLAVRSSHSQRQATFPDNVCSYSPPCHGVSPENLTDFFFLKFLFSRNSCTTMLHLGIRIWERV